jgi:hypothetical protein
MIKFKIITVIFVIGVISLCDFQVVLGNVSLNVETVYAQDDWRKEFDDICSRTQDAMTIPGDELRTLVDRCDRLKPSIEKLDETQRKIYQKRLQMCRDLFAFVLESQKGK